MKVGLGSQLRIRRSWDHFPACAVNFHSLISVVIIYSIFSARYRQYRSGDRTHDPSDHTEKKVP